MRKEIAINVLSHPLCIISNMLKMYVVNINCIYFLTPYGFTIMSIEKNYRKLNYFITYFQDN